MAAAEWGPFGVNVNVVCPLAMTPGLEKWKDEYPKLYAQTIQGIPLGRFADPEKDVGRVCVFLASEDAAYVTGETITLQACAHKACPSGPHKSGRRLFCRPCGQLSARGHRDTFSIAEQ